MFLFTNYKGGKNASGDSRQVEIVTVLSLVSTAGQDKFYANVQKPSAASIPFCFLASNEVHSSFQVTLHENTRGISEPYLQPKNLALKRSFPTEMGIHQATNSETWSSGYYKCHKY